MAGLAQGAHAHGARPALGNADQGGWPAGERVARHRRHAFVQHEPRAHAAPRQLLGYQRRAGLAAQFFVMPEGEHDGAPRLATRAHQVFGRFQDRHQ